MDPVPARSARFSLCDSQERSRNVYEKKGGQGSADLFSRSAALPKADGKAADLEKQVRATPGLAHGGYNQGQYARTEGTNPECL